MKKKCTFALIFIMMLSCIIFSACGDKYEDLEMTFYSTSGNRVESVNLIIDDDNADLQSVRVGVRFSGIDDSDIGEVEIYSSPSELISVSNERLENDTYYADISANVAKGSGKLKVKHESSGKEVSIDLTITRKATGIVSSSDTYVVSIPDTGDREVHIDASQVVTLLPESTGASDSVYFKVKDNSSVQNVSFISSEVDSSLIEGFTINSNVPNGAELLLYPVTYLDGYELTEYQDNEIVFKFIRTLTSDSVYLSTDVFHQEYLDSNETIHLIAKEIDSVIATDGKQYNFNNIQISLQYLQGENYVDFEMGGINYYDFYDIELSTDNDNITSYNSNNTLIFQAVDYTSNEVTATIRLVPKNCVGDIGLVEKKFKVKAELKPSDIEVQMQGEDVDINYSLDLYDYYASGGSALGALFNFNPIVDFSYEDLKNMRISIQPEILNAYISSNGGYVGINQIYTDDSFTTLSTSYEYAGRVLRNNKYVLEIYLHNQPLRFYYDAELQSMVSESFTNVDNLYIKYVETDIPQDNYGLELDVFTYYSGDYTYLEPISNTSINITFNRLEGVQSLEVNAGYLSLQNDAYTETIYSDANADPYPVSKVNLNRLEGTDNVDIHAYLLYVGPGNVLGDRDRVLSNATFNISVQGGQDNPLKIKQYSINDGNGKDGEENLILGEQNITYTFNSNSGVENAILFVFNQNTDVGQYKITFSHSNGYTLTIDCYVYQKMVEDDITYSFEENDKAFRNSRFVDIDGILTKEYLYEDYKADYIVASGQTLTLEVILQNYFDSNYLLGYDFNAGFLDATAESASDYLKLYNQNSLTEISFIKGTYFNNVNNYINITITVMVQNYQDIITPNGYAQIPVNVTFFIYDEIDEDDIDINIDSADKYMYEYLGAYYKDQASVNLEISILGENKQYLWNYVQAQNQESNYNIGVSGETVDEETGEVSVNQYKVIWYTQNNDDSVRTDAQGDKNIGLTFRSGQNVDLYYCDIYAEVRQFNTIFRFRSRITVHNPIITEYLTVESEVNYTADDRQDYYIDLKAGEEYVVQASNFSTLGNVTNDDIYMVIVDNLGNQNYYNIISVDNNTNTLRVRDDEIGTINRLNLIIFAKDALNQIISTSTAGFDDITSFLMDGDDENINAYKNAYVLISIYLSDGTETNPFIINDADDFWDINSNPNSHYMLMNNINVSNTSYTGERTINNFSGSIVTYQDSNNVSFVYTLYGITLGEDVNNLFVNMLGTISNITFNVNYQYDIEVSTDTYLGVIDKNMGTLTNVSVVFQGQANIDTSTSSAPYTYFGALVAENRGLIQYLSNTIVGSQGDMSLSGDANVYFGGLVGKNLSNIVGYDNSNNQTNNLNSNYSLLNTPSDSDTEIIFSVYIANEGAMADIDIRSSNTNSNSAIGGIVGINDYETIDSTQMIGRLSNAFVTGSITGLNNVGGAVGINRTPKINMTVNILNGQINDVHQTLSGVYYVENVKSNVVINANDNVGGIVGNDDGGSYKEVHYQILSSTGTGINANSRVGGIAGSSNNGVFIYSSVMSYRWDYNILRQTNNYSECFNSTPDILGRYFVAGIVGFATNDGNKILNEGDNTLETVIVQSVSVNAYILADTGSALLSDAGGILANGGSTNVSIISNAYFIGKLDGDYYYEASADQTERLALANNTNILYNNVYTVVVDQEDLVIGDYASGFGLMLIGDATDNMQDWVDSTYWAYNEEINGGYIYLLNENGECLYEIAPTSLTALIKDEYKLYYNNSVLNNLIHLDYYDFILDSANENYTTLYNELNERFNTYDLIDLFDFECTPSMLSQIRIYAESSNSAIIYVNNGELTVRGVGQCTLTFISILNTSIRASVTVDVSNAVGDDLIISDSSTNETSVDTQYIANGKAKQYYISSIGSKTHNGEEYQYRANQEIYLQVDIETSNAEDSIITYLDIPDYLNVSGITGVIDNVNQMLTYTISDDTPFSISVLQYILNDYFIVTATPYTVINYQDATLGSIQINRYLNDSTTSFHLYTRQGPSKVALNYDSVTLYPNDNTTITAYVTTDIELTDTDLTSDLIYSSSFYDIETGLILNDCNLKARIEMIRNDGLNDSGIQTVYYRLTIEEKYSATSNEPIGLHITYTLPNGENASIDFTVLPQRINKIEIKNYVYTSDDGSIAQSNVLRPTGEGLIIIDIAPNNGYYDYLEISDVTGREEIIFSQIDGVAGARLSEMDQPSSDGRGIRLIKNYDGFNGSIYVATMISNTFSSIPHTIRVTAYLNGGEQIGESFYYTIDVKMLPGIQVDYLKPTGEVHYSKTNNSSENNTIYIANNVDSRFRITTSNSDGNVDITLNSTYFEMVEDYNGYYTLKFRNKSQNLVGNTYQLTFTTRATLENGDYEEATVSLNVLVVEFVIYDISVTHSRTNLSGDTEIYGDYYEPITLEFYFDETDISFYYANSFWDRVYRYDSDVTISEDAGAIYYINEILKSLNTDRTINDLYNKYLSLSNYDTDDDGNMTGLSLIGNTLEVQSGNIGTILSLNFILKLDENCWTITTLDENITPDISNDAPAVEQVEYSYRYYLNFVNSNTYEEPEVIVDEEDFLTMQSGENVNYILAQDLVFDNYVPLDVFFRTFDGNGHTITIRSFASFDKEVIYAGLFREIYEGMIVMNLNVNYQTTSDGLGSYSFGQVSPSISTFNITYADICNNPDVNYSSAYFGAITPVNNGIITNCTSNGYVALNASVIESKTSSYNIDFYIGGLVAQNARTGYITNSTSRLSIFSLANIGGLAYSNEGKIVSSSFDAGNSIFTIGENNRVNYQNGGLIFAYNDSVLNTSLVSVAGFVVINTGEISMSFVKSNSTTLQSGNTIGNISAKDISAGFVYSSSGTIYDCYVDLSRIGANNNRFSGFINANSGSISRCYTYINEGSRNSLDVNMFAPSGTTGVSESYEIMIVPGGYSNNIEGLTTIQTSNMTQASSYPSFTFGDNESAVWYIEAGSTPKLVISQEIVTYNSNQANTEYMYYGLRNIRINIETVTDEGGHSTIITSYEIINAGYGSKNNPYLIYDIDTWNYYFTNETTDYYRLISDIDFSSVNGNPVTSEYTFKGNLQGNNMDISGLMIYSGSSLYSIGLFKEFLSAEDVSIENSVRNIDLNIRSILATKTVAVGGLAGIVEDFNIYNIDINGDGVIVVGANAVGGLAGIARGNVNIETITSNIGVNSTRTSSGYKYSIYLSKNNDRDVSYNLNNVYYAGSVVGILDGYQNANYNINSNRDIASSSYFDVKDIKVTGNITAIGDTVGAVFGFVGERVRVSDVIADISAGSISGAQYSALVAGENRGLIVDTIVNSATDTLFNNSSNVSSGVVGLNLGGYVENANASINIIKTSGNATVAGIIGRNINGYVADSTFDGNLVGYFTGGIIGSNYDREALINRLSGAGAIENESREAVPEDSLRYLNNGAVLDKISSVSISLDTLRYWLENARYFYSYSANQASFDEAMRALRVLGLLTGVSNDDNFVYKVSFDGQNLTFNGENADTYMGVVNDAVLYNGTQYDIPYSNILEFDTNTYDKTFVAYILGANVATFDAWNRETYSNSRLVLTAETDKINRLDYLITEGDTSTIYRHFFISTDTENTAINDRIYAFNLIQHTNISGTEQFNMYYEFVLNDFDEDSDLTITIANKFDDESLNTETQISLTASQIQQLINRNEAYIVFEPSRSVEITFSGLNNGEEYSSIYIFNFVN